MTNEDCRKVFKKNLRDLLVDNHMTQSELAEKIDVSDNTISSYVYGRRLPNIFHAIDIAKVFSCSVESLFKRR